MSYRSVLILILFVMPFIGISQNRDHGRVKSAGLMREVMWQGKLEPAILLDTIQPIDGLYAIGPLAGLRGEILVLNGEKYISRVINDEEMSVKVENGAGAPFLVYAHVERWRKINIPDRIEDLNALNEYLGEISTSLNKPFVFEVKANTEKAVIHSQNLPPGSKVSSPEEAHQGQFTYSFGDEDVVIIGFFSTEHQGVFTHHDSYTHMHLITEDRVLMGHLDEASFKPGSLELLVAD